MSKKLLLARIVLLKQKVANVKTAGVLQKTARAEACMEEAVFIIEELATEQQPLEELINDFGVTVNGK